MLIVLNRFSRPLFAAMPMRRILILVVLALLLGAAPAHAQFFQFPFFGRRAEPAPRPRHPVAPRTPKTEPKTEPQAEAPPETSAPYDLDLDRLAEILGTLHFLRNLCGANEGPKWRDEAQALIETEAPTGTRHDKMVDSFNRGYAGYKQVYRTCTPAAHIVIRRFLEEGSRISRDITARYAN
jgi:uncharacterized protein (TIGR02301 family)